VLFAVEGVIGYLVALTAGVVVGAAAVIALKSVGPRDTDLATV
jgi:PTS system fructose-specific IIC component